MSLGNISLVYHGFLTMFMRLLLSFAPNHLQTSDRKRLPRKLVCQARLSGNYFGTFLGLQKNFNFNLIKSTWGLARYIYCMCFVLKC